MNYSEKLGSIQEAYASMYETDSYLGESMASASRMKEIMGNERPPRSREFEKRLPTPRSREFEKRLPSPSASSSVKRGGQVQHMGRDLKNSADLFDIVKGHLMSEGYADTEESALAIMANMSEEWLNSIVEEMGPKPGTPGGPARNVAIVGPPKKAIDAIPGVRSLRIAASNYAKDQDAAVIGDKTQKVGRHSGLSRLRNIKTTSGTLISPTTKFTDKSGDK